MNIFINYDEYLFRDSKIVVLCDVGSKSGNRCWHFTPLRHHHQTHHFNINETKKRHSGKK